jgi:hypothetical protein
MQDVKWCHPKLTVEVKHLAGSKTLRHATVRKLCSLSVDTDSGGSGSSTGAYSTRDRIGCSCRIVGFGSLKRKHLVVAKRPKFQEPVSFIAEYDDGSTARFYVDRTTLRDGNHIARIVAGEKQRIGRLKPGIIVGVRRDWRHRLVPSYATAAGYPLSSSLSANSLAFCRSVTMRPGRRLTGSSNAARATSCRGQD